MKMSFLSVCKLGILGLGAAIFMIGCAEPEPQLPQYKPKALEAQGKGITIAKSTPYNCKILGEVEGKDNTQGTSGATRELLREGAINDLKNEAGETAGAGKRLMLSVTKEQVQCRAVLETQKGKVSQVVDCTDGLPSNALSGKLLSHRVHAQVFDCGDK